LPESIIPSADAFGRKLAGVSFQMLSKPHGPFAWEFPGRLLLRRRRSRSLPTWLSWTDRRETRPLPDCQRGAAAINEVYALAATPWSACAVSGQRDCPCL